MSTAERQPLADELRLYADALDKDRGHAKSRVTAVMREAADALAGSSPAAYDGECHGRCGEEYANFNCPKCRAGSSPAAEAETRNGVCLRCGEGVLENGEHITGTREPCAASGVSDTREGECRCIQTMQGCPVHDVRLTKETT